MFKNLPFAYKIGLLPVISALAFMLILTTSWYMGGQSIGKVDDIENGYYSSLELNNRLGETLELIQRSFQDAAASADLDILAETDVRPDRSPNLIGRAMENAVVDTAPLGEIAAEFNSYYAQASATTRRFVDGDMDDEVFAALQDTAARVARLHETIESLAARDKTNIAHAFTSTKDYTDRATQILMIVIAVSLGTMIVFSFLIIRVASQSVNDTVRGMNALADGNLAHATTATSNDEIGQMVSHVGEVTRTIDSLAGEISALIDAVRAGQLKVRGNADQFRGAYASLIENINELIDEFVAPIEVTGEYVERIARGDIPPPLADEYHGDFNTIKGNLNTLVSVMNGLVGQTASLTSAAQAGELDRRGSSAEFSGVWSNLIEGINETLDAVTGPMRAVTGVMSAMAGGDLTHKIVGNFRGTFAQLQHDTNATIDRLTDVIGSIKSSGDAVWVASNDIVAGNQSLLARTQEQVKSLAATTDHMGHMTGIVRQNAENAQRASTTVLAARDKAQEGGNVVGNAVRAMDEINSSSKKISEIINVINEIAFQTNLLALNASVEAARAGEEGRGFAVVASEVRNLAGRSANAAKEIGELIEDSVGKVEEGSRLVNESGRTLEQIVSAVANVTEIVSEISAASGKQANSIEVVNRAVAQMEQITKQNSALVDEATTSSRTMGAEARKLKEKTAFFTVDAGDDERIPLSIAG